MKNGARYIKCGVLCVIPRSAILIEHRLVTDTDRHKAIVYTALAWRRAVKRELFFVEAGISGQYYWNNFNKCYLLLNTWQNHR